MTLPQLEGVKRLAAWSNEPGAAIWSAAVAPRRLSDGLTRIEGALLGQPLKNQLRWSFNEVGELHWACAA